MGSKTYRLKNAVLLPPKPSAAEERYRQRMAGIRAARPSGLDVLQAAFNVPEMTAEQSAKRARRQKADAAGQARRPLVAWLASKKIGQWDRSSGCIRVYARTKSEARAIVKKLSGGTFPAGFEMEPVFNEKGERV